MATERTITKHISSIIDDTTATAYYNYLRDNIEWEDGVKSKSGSTRLAKSIDIADKSISGEFINKVVIATLNKISTSLNSKTFALLGIYLNYYKDGTHHTPSHSHPGMVQLIISLGGTRTLKVGNKDYVMKNGDVMIFGSSTHSVPKEEIADGRISIATFMMKGDSINKLLG